MLTGKFSYIQQNEVSEFSISLSKSELDISSEVKPRKIIALAISHKEDFIKKYFEIKKEGHIPLILNPEIPQKKLIELAKEKDSHVLKLDDNKVIAFESPIVDSPAGHILCSSGTTSKSGTQKSFFFSFPKPLKNANAHCESLNIKANKKVLFPLPITHSFGVVVDEESCQSWRVVCVFGVCVHVCVCVCVCVCSSEFWFLFAIMSQL